MITLAETQDNVSETSYSVCFRHVFGSYNIRGYANLRIGNVLFQMLPSCTLRFLLHSFGDYFAGFLFLRD